MALVETMRTRILIATFFLAAIAAPGAMAQNSDLAVLLGVTFPATQVNSTHVSTSAGASVQINYAYQIWGSAHSSLYMEFPVVISAGSGTNVSVLGVTASQGATVLFTPGVRIKVPLHARLSLYAAAGGGIGAFGGNRVVVTHGQVSVGHHSVSPAMDFGGGLDIRLTRLLSLRGEVRDFVSRAGLGGVAGRNHVIGQAGVAFHF